MDRLLIETERLQVGVNGVQPALLEHVANRLGQITVVAIRRNQGVALFGEALVVVDQVGETAVAYLRNDGQTARRGLAGRESDRSQPHRLDLFRRLGERQESVVGCVVQGCPGIAMHVVEHFRLEPVRQVDVRSAGESARLIEYQSRGVQTSSQHRHGMLQPLEIFAHDLVEDLPLDDARPVAVAKHGRADLVFDSIAQVRCDGRPTTHAFDRHPADDHHAHLVAQVEPHRRRRLAPRTDHVEAALFGKLNLPPGHFLAIGIGQTRGV